MALSQVRNMPDQWSKSERSLTLAYAVQEMHVTDKAAMLHRYFMAWFKCLNVISSSLNFKIKSCSERNFKILHYNTMLNKFCS